MSLIDLVNYGFFCFSFYEIKSDRYGLWTKKNTNATILKRMRLKKISPVKRLQQLRFDKSSK